MKLNPPEEELKKELPHLWYIGFFNPKAWKSGNFVPGEEWSWFKTLSEDIEDPDKPKTHWWWHPELWKEDIDPIEVLKGIC